MVDDSDYNELSRFRWMVAERDGAFYATAKMDRPASSQAKSKKVPRYMHRYLLNPQMGYEVDHKDGNGLNNQRNNLRIVTHQRNMQAHRSKRQKTTSRFRGVTWHKGRKCWQAQIKLRISGKTVYMFLGNFSNEYAAAKEYNSSALFFGFPQEALNKVA